MTGAEGSVAYPWDLRASARLTALRRPGEAA
jgi:hypothetical protein